MLGPEQRPEALEALAGRLEGLAGGALVSRLPLHGSERQSRAPELEWVRLLRRIRDHGRGLERTDCRFEVAVRREQQSPATLGERAERRVRARGAGVEQGQQPLRGG